MHPPLDSISHVIGMCVVVAGSLSSVLASGARCPRTPEPGPPDRSRTDGIEEFEATLYRLAYLDFGTVVITFGG